jgi:integrase
VPGLGNMLLTQLKPEHLMQYYAGKLNNGRCDGQGGLSPRSVRYHHFTIHTALKMAVKWGILNRNPADAVDPPHFERPEMHTLNEEDIQRLLIAAKNTQYYTLFFMALFTGMRRSELLALRWQDVDLLLCQAFVTRSMHQLQDGSIIFREPKTVKSRCMISLSPSTAIELRDHQEKQKLTFSMQGLSLKDDTLIFCQVDGRPLLPNSVTHAWIKLVRRLGLNGIRLHDARHSHASLMLKQGIHPKIVQERLGHSSIQTTLDVYSHVAPGLQEAAANRFDDIMISIPKKEQVERQR